MYDIIIENNISKMSIVGKIITTKNSLSYSDIIFTMDLKNDLFKQNTISKELIENNSEMTEINFFGYNDEDIYLLNLHYLPNLTCLCFIDFKNSFLPTQLFSLTNLKELTISTFEDEYSKKNIQNDIVNIEELKTLINLESLNLNVNLKKFPKCILSMKKLKNLTIIAKHNLLIPSKLCNLDKLMNININIYHQNILIYKNKMIIFRFNNSIKIPDEITELKVLDVSNCSLDNLPLELEKLKLGCNILLPLDNLPVLLKKLYIKKQVYIEEFQDKIKIPFDCKFKIYP